MKPARRAVFAGTPEFAVASLRALIAAGVEVVAVYTQPDRPSGRGRRLTPSPVKAAALEHRIEVRQPPNFRAEADLAALEALAPELMVVAAYGLLLPQRVLDAPRLGCVNVHASILPRWRGAAPIQRAILAGDSESGITIMQMDAGLDTGAILHVRRCPILPGETGGSLHDKLAALGGEALAEALPGILDGTLTAVAQDAAQATYARKLDKAEAEIDWHAPAATIERQVRAFNPWPVAQTRWRGAPLRIWGAVAVAGGGEPGAVVAAGRDGIEVATGAGRLRITRLQLPGKRPLGAAEFLNAQRVDDARFG